jgi:hypothetical protein
MPPGLEAASDYAWGFHPLIFLIQHHSTTFPDCVSETSGDAALVGLPRLRVIALAGARGQAGLCELRWLEDCRCFSGHSMLCPYGILLRQDVWAKKAGASSRTPQNRSEAPFGVRRLAAAFTAYRQKIKRAGPSQRTLGESLGDSRDSPSFVRVNRRYEKRAGFVGTVKHIASCWRFSSVGL